ncbi:MAG: hypothetical protein R3C44_08930 [Chloroflexota bacterium]
MMGEPTGADILGLLIDESLPVEGEETLPPPRLGNDLLDMAYRSV